MRTLKQTRWLLLLVALTAVCWTSALAQEHDQHKAADPHAKQEGKHDDAKHDKHAAHAEPTALEHVGDMKDFWHLFNIINPHAIPLPPFLSKFVLLELLAAGLIILIYVPLAKRLQSGQPPRGGWDNAFETLLTFVRDQVAKPTLGDKDADRYVPFLWTMFLFILFNNLLGMVPFLGSATANIYMTAALALIVFFAIHGSAIMEMANAEDHGHGHDHGHDHDHSHSHGHDDHAHSHGSHGGSAEGMTPQKLLRGVVRYAKSYWPNIDLPIPVVGVLIKTMVCIIEVVGTLVRNLVLAVRLFANMFAGHMVLATILIFIYMARATHPFLWSTVTISSVAGILALSLLEIFIAFLQAYIFTFLASLFMGMAIHPQH